MAKIQCPSCETTFEVDGEAYTGFRRMTRCTVCENQWLAGLVKEEQEMVSVVAEEDKPVLHHDEISRSESELTDEIIPADGIKTEVEGDLSRIDSLTEAGSQQPADIVVANTPASALPAKPMVRRQLWDKPQPIRQTTHSWSPGKMTSLMLAVAACLVIAVAFRKSIVRIAPDAGRYYAAAGLPVNLRGLELKDVKGGVVTEAGGELLVVQGEIRNISTGRQTVPGLLFTIRDAKGVPVYSWATSSEDKLVQPGQAISFRRRLAAPPVEGFDVVVRFAGA